MVQELINTYEELKKYTFIIDRQDKGNIIIKFSNENFYHLVGLHKIKNFDNYFPDYIKSKDKKYKYIKKNVEKFDNILENQLKEKNTLKLRITSFSNLLDLIRGDNYSLYKLNPQNYNSLYDGDFGLMKIYQICCLLGLKIKENKDNQIECFPNSWMASHRINKLVEFRRPIYFKSISAIPLEKSDVPCKIK